MFDEPSSYLDVKQRLKCALTIRSLLSDDRYGDDDDDDDDDDNNNNNFFFFLIDNSKLY